MLLSSNSHWPNVKSEVSVEQAPTYVLYEAVAVLVVVVGGICVLTGIVVDVPTAQVYIVVPSPASMVSMPAIEPSLQAQRIDSLYV